MAGRQGFRPSDVKRISGTVRFHEGYYRYPPPPAAKGQRPSSVRTVPVICPSGGIAAGSRSSPTSGTGTFAVPGSGNAIVAGDSITLWNYKAAAVASGGKTADAYWWNGKWVLSSWEC